MAGTYRITANPGSPPISGVRQDIALAPRVRARVTGRGVERRLVYRITTHPGQLVTFIERSRQVERVLGSTRLGHGSIRFRAAAGRDRRQILAAVTVDGRPSTSFAVASYAPPALERLGRVRGLRVRRLRSRVRMAFAAVPGARAYDLYLRLADGPRRSYRIVGRRLRIAGICLEVGGRVLVRAAGDRVYTASGPAAAATVPVWLRPSRPPRDRRPAGRTRPAATLDRCPTCSRSSASRR